MEQYGWVSLGGIKVTRGKVADIALAASRIAGEGDDCVSSSDVVHAFAALVRDEDSYRMLQQMVNEESNESVASYVLSQASIGYGLEDDEESRSDIPASRGGRY